MKRFFYFLIILFCFSCKEKQNFITEQIQLSEPKQLEVVKTTRIPAKCVTDYFITVDSLLLMTTYCDSMCFSVYNKFTHEFVISFGYQGKGELDISCPLLYRSTNYDSGKILAYDGDLCKDITINMDSIVKGTNPYRHIKFSRQSKELWWTENLSYLTANKIAGTNVANFSGDGMFFIYDTEKKNMQWIDFNPKYEYEDNDCLGYVYANITTANKNKQFIAAAFRSIDMICLYDFDGSCKKRICFSNLKKPVINKKYVDNNEKLYFLRLVGTEQYLYAVRGNISAIDVQNGVKYHPGILKFDWDGNFICNYTFDRSINAFCVDEDRMRIYIVASTENPEYEELIELQM
jgi:hypothetical protein